MPDLRDLTDQTTWEEVPGADKRVPADFEAPCRPEDAIEAGLTEVLT
ncbi:hypothetical protein AB0F17_62920 [Nonomuraea sp. NPDC026600]